MSSLEGEFFIKHLVFSLPFPWLCSDAIGNISGVVSPEQSEDGGLPLVGESDGKATVAQVQNIIAARVAAVQNQALASSVMQVAPMPSAPASTTFPTLPAAVASVATLNGVAKRRRVETPLAPLPGSQGIMNNHIVAVATSATTPAAAAAAAAAMTGRGRKKSQAQIDRRRERNRILARRTRLRKKFFFESLQKDVMDLQRENAALKEIAKLKLDEAESKALLDQCDAMEKLPSSVLEACGENAEGMDQQDFNLVRSIQRSQRCFVITDPSLQDNPIVYASDGFLSLTCYAREEVLGRNCRFLQGSETHQSKVDTLRKSISNGEDVTVTFINYTADGTPFWNKLFVAALRDAQDNIVNFIGVIVKVQGPSPDDEEHGKLLPGEPGDDDDDDYDDGDRDMAQMADGTMQAMEGVVSAAVAASGSD